MWFSMNSLEKSCSKQNVALSREKYAGNLLNVLADVLKLQLSLMNVWFLKDLK